MYLYSVQLGDFFISYTDSVKACYSGTMKIGVVSLHICRGEAFVGERKELGLGQRRPLFVQTIDP